MKEMLYYLIVESTVTRQVIYAFTGQVLIFYLADKMLVCRHNRIPLIICLIIKTLIYYPTELYFHLHPELNAATHPGILLYGFWRDIIITSLFLWTYSRNRGKAGLSLLIGETGMVLLTFPVIALLNFLEGRDTLTALSYPFMAADLLIPVLFGMIWWIIRRPVLAMAARYRAWRPKRPVLLWAVFLLYWLSSSVTGLAAEVMTTRSSQLLMVHRAWGAAGMVMLTVWLLYQEKQEEIRHDYLIKQAAFASAYDRVLEKNRMAAEKMQQQIHEQMEELSQRTLDGSRLEQDQLRDYLEQLREEAAALQISGVYCGNYLVDAVLCMEQQMLEKLGYRADFRCVNVPEHMEDTATLPQIVELVCEEWMEQKKGRNARAWSGSSENENICHLQIMAARGQILITANIPGKWNRARKKLLKEFLAAREGVFADNKDVVKHSDNGQVCTILIPITSGEAGHRMV